MMLRGIINEIVRSLYFFFRMFYFGLVIVYKVRGWDWRLEKFLVIIRVIGKGFLIIKVFIRIIKRWFDF